jgi:hypothetical protein
VVVHGHTHVPREEEIDGVLYLNPGSVSEPRRGSEPGIMTIVVEERRDVVLVPLTALNTGRQGSWVWVQSADAAEGMPGVQTFTEIVTAMDYGCDIVKLFPASAVGIGFIKAVSGPLPQARVIPVGGVDINNIDKWFDDGAYAVALGTGLTHPTKGTCDYEEIKNHAAAVVAKVKSCKRK